MATKLYDHDVEQALLGALLTDSLLLEECAELAPQDLHHPGHALILAAMVALPRPFDTLAVRALLESRGQLEAVGGLAYLWQLDQCVPDMGGVRRYAATIRGMALRRQAVAKARELAEAAHDLEADPSELLLSHSSTLAKLGAAGADRILTGRDVVRRLTDKLHRVQSGEEPPVIRTGIKVWDHLLGGLQRGTVTMLGAPPSTGKTAVETTIALNLAQAYRDNAQGAGRTGIVWLEDPLEALGRRGLAYTSTVPVWRIAKEVLSGPALELVGQGLIDLDELIGDAWRVHEGSGVTIAQLDVVLRQMVVQHGCKVLMVDHLGEVEADGQRYRGARHLEVRDVVRCVRNVAKDLDVPVLLLLHLKRASTQAGKDPRQQRPTLESGGESSAIEKMARTMVYLWEDPEHPGYVAAHVPKQTEGEKGFDFYMRMNKAAALVYSHGGKVPEGVRGYTDGEGLEVVAKRQEEQADAA